MYIKPHGHNQEEERKAWIDLGCWIKSSVIAAWNRLLGRPPVAATPVFNDGHPAAYDEPMPWDVDHSVGVQGEGAPEMFELEITGQMLLLFGSGARLVQFDREGDIHVTYSDGEQKIYIASKVW
jgi:hypothetical protein